MASSPPSFDHLPFATTAEREHYTHPIQAQICRNGQMKYARTRASAVSAEIVMPDGEVIAREDGDDWALGASGDSRQNGPGPR